MPYIRRICWSCIGAYDKVKDCKVCEGKGYTVHFVGGAPMRHTDDPEEQLEDTEQSICSYHGKPSRRSGLGCPDCYEDHPPTKLSTKRAFSHTDDPEVQLSESREQMRGER